MFVLYLSIFYKSLLYWRYINTKYGKKKMIIKPISLAVVLFILSTNLSAAILTTTFNSLETAGSERHTIRNYQEGDLQFEAKTSHGNEELLHYEGQSAPGYQGSAALYTRPNSAIIMSLYSGSSFNMISMDFADLCGELLTTNSRCIWPGHPFNLTIRTYIGDPSDYIINSEDILLFSGASGVFQTYVFAEHMKFGVTRVDVVSSSFSDYVQIDNIVYETSEVPIPSAIWLMGTGITGLMGVARKKKSAA